MPCGGPASPGSAAAPAAVRHCEVGGDSRERPPEVRAACRGQRVSSDSRQSQSARRPTFKRHMYVGHYRDVSTTDELEIANCYHAVHVAVITLSPKYICHTVVVTCIRVQ